MEKVNKLITILLLVIIVVPLVSSYKIEPGESATHQKITKEAIDVWEWIPYEIKNHTGNSIDGNLDLIGNFDSGDDIITGSGEEDRAVGTYVHAWGNHFWNPDDPNTPSMLGNDDYNDGLRGFGSSYRRALKLWRTEVIPSYLKGNINRSYYYLGRVAHLLEDATQPSHALLDAHGGFLLGGDSVLEDYVGDPDVYNTFNGSIYSGQQYNYDNLIEGFDWSEVQPTRTPDNLYPEFFRLFWYTAQKTQYWASDDSDGNRHYVALNGSTIFWDCGDSGGEFDLWEDEALGCGDMVIYESDLDETTVEQEANATIPHAMKSVAGLYKLFWDAVHIDWPTENHDYRRTGFTLLKGDLAKEEDIENQMDFFLGAAEGDIEQVVKPSIADLDGNGDMDIVVLVHKTSFNTFTNMYGIEKQEKWYGDKVVNKWGTYQIEGGEDGAIYFPPTLADIDNDGKKEIITGTRNGTVYAYELSGNQLSEKWVYYLETRSDGVNQVLQFNGGSAVADIDLDGDMEVKTGDAL